MAETDDSNPLDRLFEINAAGDILREIDVAGLRVAGETDADVEGLAWLGGTRYAVLREGAEEMLIVNINSGTTALTRAGAAVYDLSGDPKGVAYNPVENAIYWVSQNNPMRVVKSQINATTGQLDEIFSRDVSNLPASELNDIAFFPRLSPNPILISASSATVMEVDVTNPVAVLRSSFTLAAFPIPAGSGLTFAANTGRLHVICKNTGGVPEDNYTVFAPNTPIPNQGPRPRIEGFIGWLDEDGDGEQPVMVSGARSADADGMIIRYEWLVNGKKVAEGIGRDVADLRQTLPVGKSSVTLRVWDDLQAMGEQTEQVDVAPKASKLPAMVSSDTLFDRSERLAFAFGPNIN